jgi:hypothetical protein
MTLRSVSPPLLSDPPALSSAKLTLQTVEEALGSDGKILLSNHASLSSAKLALPTVEEILSNVTPALRSN